MIYVSPLKALSNDVQKNLEAPLAEISALAAERGVPLAPIRTALRTGDTLAWDRQRMLAHPPHILVTTPESLFILLTAEKSRQMLRTARAVIVDEIHAIVDDKRGAHLALSLARLDALAGRRLQRIGLSATVKPIELVARFLGDDTRIIQIGHRREMDLFVEVPKSELGAVASNEMWDEIYNRLAELIRSRRTTLVFVNTRRLAERVSHHLTERLGPNCVLPHHGSLSRGLRLESEGRLKRGELRAVVATASLELGIDIGSVDLVCQIGSPRAIAVALQRIGRSGHWVGAKPEGRLFATTRDELIECAALVSRDPLRRAGRAADARRAARYPGPADRRRRRLRRVRRRRPVRAGSLRLPLSLARAQGFRRRDRDAVGRNRQRLGPPRRVSASRPGQPHGARTPRRAAGRDHLRRRDSGERELPGGRRAGRRRGRNGR